MDTLWHISINHLTDGDIAEMNDSETENKAFEWNQLIAPGFDPVGRLLKLTCGADEVRLIMEEDERWSPDLLEVLIMAHKRNVKYILLDGEGVVVDGLNTYNNQGE
jgi:hypothetical protein